MTTALRIVSSAFVRTVDQTPSAVADTPRAPGRNLAGHATSAYQKSLQSCRLLPEPRIEWGPELFGFPEPCGKRLWARGMCRMSEPPPPLGEKATDAFCVLLRTCERRGISSRSTAVDARSICHSEDSGISVGWRSNKQPSSSETTTPCQGRPDRYMKVLKSPCRAISSRC